MELSAPQQNPLPTAGESFGRYRVLELIGRGGMGQVYKVSLEDDPGGSPLALKVIDSPNLTRTDRLRFEREFQLASRFSHPNLVKVYDFGSRNAVMYFTMEWVRGRNIEEAFQAELSAAGGERFPEAAVGWLDGVLCGLNTLHEAGIVHRDLKPENILLDLQGQPKLLDLGLASHFTDDASMSRLTSPGSVLGTIHYMAPEQIIGAELDRRSDLYSLGVLLYHWFCGRLPFTAGEPIAVLGKILHEPTPPVEPRFPLPQAACDLVARLLKKNPDDRPANAETVRELWSRSMGLHGADRPTLSVLPAMEALPLPPRMVGREELLREAQEALMSVEHQGLRVLVRGAQGFGKSRCLQELRHWAKRRRWKVLQMSASPLDTLPFQPLLEPLRTSLRFGMPESLEGFREELSLLLPELSSEAQSSGDLEMNAMRRYRLFEGMRRLLTYDRRQTDEPVTLITLEELQLAGDETLAFLHFLRQRPQSPGENRLILAASLGPAQTLTERSHRRLEETVRESKPLDRTLGPIDKDEARALILSMLGGGELDSVSLEALFRQSEGNPLFVIEMTRFFLEEGRLTRLQDESGARWKLHLAARSESSTSVEIPASLKAVVGERLEPLPAEDRALLRKAAFLGLRFSFTMLAAISERPDAEVLDRLLELARLGLVREGKGSDTFDFCNSVVPAVLLDSATPAEKRRTHLTICREALARRSEQTDPFWLAWHYREAGEPEQARTHLLSSAQRAYSSFSFSQAAALFREVLQSEPESTAVAGLQENLADSLLQCGELQEALDLYRPLLESAPEPSLARSRLLRKIAIIEDRRGCAQTALELSYQAWHSLGLRDLRSLEGGAPFATLVKALTWDELSLPSSSANRRFRPEEAGEIAALAMQLQRALYLLRPSGWVRQGVEIAIAQRQAYRAIDQDALASALADFNGGFLSLRLPRGWQSSSLRLLRRCRDKALRTPASLARLSLMRDCGYLLHLAGASEEGLKLLREASSIAEELGHLVVLPFLYSLAASAAFAVSEMDEAYESAFKALHLSDALGNRRDWVLSACQLSRSSVALGRLDEADELLEKLSTESFDSFPYLRILHAQTCCERSLAQPCSPSDLEKARVAVERGFELCREMDELRYQRLVFRVLKLQVRAAALEPLEESDWTRVERRLAHFPHLRYRLKAVKYHWLCALGQAQQAQELKQRLIERPECTAWRRAQLDRELSSHSF